MAEHTPGPWEIDTCPQCGAELEHHTAIVWLAVAESRLYPAEYGCYLYEPCPDCGAEGEL